MRYISHSLSFSTGRAKRHSLHARPPHLCYMGFIVGCGSRKIFLPTLTMPAHFSLFYRIITRHKVSPQKHLQKPRRIVNCAGSWEISPPTVLKSLEKLADTAAFCQIHRIALVSSFWLRFSSHESPAFSPPCITGNGWSTFSSCTGRH